MLSTNTLNNQVVEDNTDTLNLELLHKSQVLDIEVEDAFLPQYGQKKENKEIKFISNSESITTIIQVI